VDLPFALNFHQPECLVLQFDTGTNLELLDLRRMASNSDVKKLPLSISQVFCLIFTSENACSQPTWLTTMVNISLVNAASLATSGWLLNAVQTAIRPFF